MKILYFRFLDWAGSKWRTYWKLRRLKRKWGANWESMSRRGRKLSRVVYSVDDTLTLRYHLRDEPGWEWTCQNCKTYCFVTEAMMPEIMAYWRARTEDAIKRGYKAYPPPTPATAGCTNCRYLPGDPE